MKKLLRFTSLFIIVCFLLGTAGCFKKLVGTTISGIITEAGKPVGIDFPASKITLLNNGSIVETLETAQSQQNWKFIAKPGIYQLEVESAGRRLKVPVDSSKGSVLGLKLNFDTVVIYGEVMLEGRPVTRAAGPVRLDLLRDGTIIETVELTGNYKYQFVVPNGQYRLRAFAGSQEVEVAVNAAASCNRSIDLAGELKLTGSITELGATLDSNWPGGTITVKTPDGRTAGSCDIVPGQATYDLIVWPSKYTVIAESYGRKVEKNVDLSEKDGQVHLDFTDIVLHGSLSGDSGTPSCTIKVKQGSTTIKEQTFNDGASGYYFVLSPNATYTLETAVPSIGALRVKDIVVGKSTKHDINLTEKVTVTGQVYENQFLPTAGEFPIGDVVLKDGNGVKRAEGKTDSQGHFAVKAYYGSYTVEVNSFGRVTSTAADLSAGPKETNLNYTDVVLSGEFKLGTSALPGDFPEATIKLVSNGVTKQTVTLARGTSSFKTVIPGGSYILKMTLANNPANIEYIIPGEIKTSDSKAIDLGTMLSRVSGNVSTIIGPATGQTGVYLFKAGSTNPLVLKLLDSSNNYEIYVNKGNYDLAIGNTRYRGRWYKNQYANGDLRLDMKFEEVDVWVGYKGRTTVDTDVVLFSVTYSGYDDKFATPLPPEYVIHRGQYRYGMFTTIDARFEVTVKIGEPVYLFVAHGTGMLVHLKSNTTFTENGQSCYITGV
jgi:hypothetical protein